MTTPACEKLGQHPSAGTVCRTRASSSHSPDGASSTRTDALLLSSCRSAFCMSKRNLPLATPYVDGAGSRIQLHWLRSDVPLNSSERLAMSPFWFDRHALMGR